MPAKVLLTGASGYIGGRLLPLLQADGLAVRCLARRPEFLTGHVPPGTEIVQGNVLDPASLTAALEGVETAYYLIHSMGDGGNFQHQERRGAIHFAHAAKAAGVARIIYLGGLGDPEGALSPHLSSRHEVGMLLRESGAHVIELRASIVIGSGSLSFEMVRTLVERLPVMITPRWVSVLAQPIAVEDVLGYLKLARTLPTEGHRIYEIGGADRVSYGDLMREYARQRGLRRRLIRVPVLSPRLSSLWLGLITPLYARVGRKLLDSVRHPTVVRNPGALHDFPLKPMGIRTAIQRALANEDEQFARTRWSDALSSTGPEKNWGGIRFGMRLVERHALHAPYSAQAAFKPIVRIGGDTGWYYANALWRLRGFLDLLCGGVGMRRSRRDPNHLIVGDAVDFWRVEAFEPDCLLRLHAEMKLPGRAWLQFEAQPSETGCTLCQTAIFDPIGLAGLAYWYALYPFHHLIFRGMLRRIVRSVSAT